MSSGNNQTISLLSNKFQHLYGDVPQSDIESLYGFIRSQPNGEETLKAMLKVPKPLTPSGTFNVSSEFQNSTSATGSIFNGWVYARVQVNAQSFRKYSTANLGGVCPGFPGGALFGTLYYNNEGDLNGDCDVVMGGIAAYIYVTFIRDGSQIASFHAGNVGYTGPCIMGGSTKWEKY